MTIILFLIMVCALAGTAFCAGTEIGFLSVNRGRIVHLAREGSKAAKILSSAVSNMSSTLVALLVGNNLSAVVFSSASAALSARMFTDSALSRFVWSVIAAFTILYIGEFLPKLFFSTRPLRRSLKVAPAYRIFEMAMRPLTAVFSAFIRLFVKMQVTKYTVTIGDLVRILQDRKDGVKISDFESALISRILVLRKKGETLNAANLLAALDDFSFPHIPQTGNINHQPRLETRNS